MTKVKKTSEGMITRRAALARLGIASSVAYFAPIAMKLSEARASGGSGASGGGSGGGGSSASSGGGAGGSGTGGSGTGGSGASGPSGTRDVSDFLNARKAHKSGEVKPLYEVVNSVKKELGGSVIGVRFRKGSNTPRYELKMVSSQGVLVTVTVDARDARVLDIARNR